MLLIRANSLAGEDLAELFQLGRNDETAVVVAVYVVVVVVLVVVLGRPELFDRAISVTIGSRQSPPRRVPSCTSPPAPSVRHRGRRLPSGTAFPRPRLACWGARGKCYCGLALVSIGIFGLVFALPVEGGWVVHFEEHLQQFVVGNDAGS